MLLCMALILPLPGTLDHTRSRRNSPALEPSASARSAADETLRMSDADIDPIMNLPRRSTTANPLTRRLCITAKHPAAEKSDETAATANVPRVNPSDSIVAVLGKLPSASWSPTIRSRTSSCDTTLTQRGRMSGRRASSSSSLELCRAVPSASVDSGSVKTAMRCEGSKSPTRFSGLLSRPLLTKSSNVVSAKPR